MKKVVLFLAMFLPLCLFAQTQVTKFMGIPVDGFKKDMIRKIEAKGFVYDKEKDCLSGEFNGEQVNVFVLTNNNKVWRIALIDKQFRDEAGIRIRFNNLYDQFLNNKKYVVALAGTTAKIPDNEDISYEMTVHSKAYQAAFNQKDEQSKETESVAKTDEKKEEFERILRSKFNLSFEEYANKPKEVKDSIFISVNTDIMYDYMTALSMRNVWFAIGQTYGYYTLAIYYDNRYNCANGEDL